MNNKQYLFLLLPFLIVLTIMSCNHPDQHPVPLDDYYKPAESGIQTGGVKMIPVETPKGTYKVWTRRVGNNPQIKVLLLHGGPGCTHEYLECFSSFLPQEGIEFIYYDQLACGNSENPGDTSLYDLDRFVEEVEQVRKALHLDQNNFFLYGHSWGGILAMQYSLKYQQNLKGLIISDMMASCPKYDQYASDVLSKQMSADVLDRIMKLEAAGLYSDPEYMSLLKDHFYKKHICRMEEWPEPVERMFRRLNGEMYVMMQGPSEFGISGKLENWDVSAELKHIAIPTLVIGATHDTMDPEYMKWMSEEFPQGEFLLCPQGSHMCMYDDQQVFFEGLIGFLKRIGNPQTAE
ncbi:MAG: proline iminopeptidase-family hydrolase [Flavobacteriales bacterium]|nr:proline iminopeptidase-family hydrolase [Flavobacteriales bacterium]